MKITLQRSDQFGPQGPQKGARMEAFGFVVDTLTGPPEVWFQCTAIGWPGYFVVCFDMCTPGWYADTLAPSKDPR